jgi:hypothetical protein
LLLSVFLVVTSTVPVVAPDGTWSRFPILR